METAGVGRKRWFLDLLGRARSLFKGLGTPPLAKVQYYSVVCPLGHRLRGQRTGGYQALRCPSCGEGIFVLPASPLPEPAPAERSARGARPSLPEPTWTRARSSSRTRLKVKVDIVEPDDLGPRPRSSGTMRWRASRLPAGWRWRDNVDRTGPKSPLPDLVKISVLDLAQAPLLLGRQIQECEPRLPRPDRRRNRPPGRHRPRVGRRPPADGRRARSIQGRGFVPGGGNHAGTSDLARPRTTRGFGRRPLVVLACVALLVLGTFAWRTWRQRRENLPQVVRIGRTEGISALEEGKFDKANQLLSAAKEAVDSLGGAVEDAEKIRHAADEARSL